MIIKCSFCKDESIISYSDMMGYKNVCQNHYRIKLIEDIESTGFVKNICKKCDNGILLYQGLGVAKDSVLVSFACSNCNHSISVKRKISSYFGDNVNK